MNQEIFQVFIASIVVPIISIAYVNFLISQKIDKGLLSSLSGFLNVSRGFGYLAFMIAPISFGYYLKVFFDSRFYDTFLNVSYGIFFNLLFMIILGLVGFTKKNDEIINIKVFSFLFKMNVFTGYLGVFIIVFIALFELKVIYIG